jgi:hypothetical protein
MIEKVARALVNNADATYVNWKEKDWPVFVELAKAAIEAMREPNDKMQEELYCLCNVFAVDWNKVINAALKED